MGHVSCDEIAALVQPDTHDVESSDRVPISAVLSLSPQAWRVLEACREAYPAAEAAHKKEPEQLEYLLRTVRGLFQARPARVSADCDE